MIYFCLPSCACRLPGSCPQLSTNSHGGWKRRKLADGCSPQKVLLESWPLLWSLSPTSGARCMYPLSDFFVVCWMVNSDFQTSWYVQCYFHVLRMWFHSLFSNMFQVMFKRYRQEEQLNSRNYAYIFTGTQVGLGLQWSPQKVFLDIETSHSEAILRALTQKMTSTSMPANWWMI